MYMERNALAALRSRRTPKTSGRILCYHSIGQAEYGVNDVTPALFRRQLEFALSAGYRFVPAHKLATTGGDAQELAITFDDAFRTVLEAASPILKEYSIPWTVFVVSEWSEHKNDWSRGAILDWRGLDKALAEGAEIGSHSMTHPDFAKIESAQMQEELFGSRRLIEDRLGVPVSSFAIPLGQSMNWPDAAGQMAVQAGYKLIYAQAERTRPRDTVARTFVTHFDDERIFAALLAGAFDTWEEWVWE